MCTSAPPSSSARDLLAGRRFHERRPAQEDRAGALHDDGLVRHRRHVRAARGARAHHDRHLRNAVGRHARLVEEDAPEVVAIGEHLGLERQERAAGVDEVDARQAIVERDLLRPHVLLHRHRVVRAALHGGVVGHDDHLAAGDAADARDDPGSRRLIVVHAEGGQRRQLEERRAGIEQALDPFTDGQLPLLRGAARRTAGRHPAGRWRDGSAARRPVSPCACGSRGTRRSWG